MSDRTYTKKQIVERIQVWCEMHNPEFDWDWNDEAKCELELQQAFAQGVTVNIPDLFSMFN